MLDSDMYSMLCYISKQMVLSNTLAVMRHSRSFSDFEGSSFKKGYSTLVITSFLFVCFFVLFLFLFGGGRRSCLSALLQMLFLLVEMFKSLFIELKRKDKNNLIV